MLASHGWTILSKYWSVPNSHLPLDRYSSGRWGDGERGQGGPGQELHLHTQLASLTDTPSVLTLRCPHN